MDQKTLKVIYIEFNFKKAYDDYSARQRREINKDWSETREVTIPWDYTWDNKRLNQTCYRLAEYIGIPVRKAWVQDVDDAPLCTE